MPKTILLALLMASTTPGVAVAQEPTVSLRVSYADLDLSASDGRKALDRRLRQAVESLCPDDNGIRDLSRLTVIRQCRASKLAALSGPRREAIARAGSRPAVTAALH